MKHTPGPWFITDSDLAKGGGPFDIWAGDTFMEREIVAFTGATVGTPKERKANAFLIMAAPDLAEAARAILAVVDPEGIGCFENNGSVAGITASGDVVLKGAFLRDLANLRTALARARSGA